MDQKSYNTVVIAGGASKCIAAVGALEYLFKCGKLEKIEKYAGTSAGGIICYLLAIGFTPLQIITFLTGTQFIEEFQSINLLNLLSKKGLINYFIIQEYLERMTIDKIGFIPTFLEIRKIYKKELTLVTYNMTENKIEYLNADTVPNMSLLIALRMTTAVPVLFERFFYKGSEYVDGGIVDNFPIQYYDNPGNSVIGLNVNPITVDEKTDGISYIMKIFMVPSRYFGQKKCSDRVDVIEINAGIKSFDFNLSISQRMNIFSTGYQSVKAAFQKEEKDQDEKDQEKIDQKEVDSIESIPELSVKPEQLPIEISESPSDDVPTDVPTDVPNDELLNNGSVQDKQSNEKPLQELSNDES